MATVVFRNAVLLFRGVDVSGTYNEVAVTFASDLVDGTTFGADTHIKKGTLTTVGVTGRGYVEFGTDLPDPMYFNQVGVDDDILTVFVNGVTEGTTTDKGFACKVVTASLKEGGAIGALLPFDVTFEGRGITGAA